MHRAWVYKLKARYEAEGEAALEPRSRRPKTSPNALDPAVVTLILELRDKLSTAGLDAGPETIAWHLAQHHQVTVSRATIARTLARAGLVTPEPRKRPASTGPRPVISGDRPETPVDTIRASGVRPTTARAPARPSRRLAKMRKLADGSDQAAAVDELIADLREIHRRRPRLQQEFDRAGLP